MNRLKQAPRGTGFPEVSGVDGRPALRTTLRGSVGAALILLLLVLYIPAAQARPDDGPVVTPAPPTTESGGAELPPAEVNRPQPSRTAPPPSIVELALQQILVERDLDQARSLLSAALVGALNQVSNPSWIARVYALLAAISLLEGDDGQAQRLSLRAVAIDPAVRLEPQLGEAAQGMLATARQAWRDRPADASVSLLELPPGLEAYLDGVKLETPGTRAVKAGDHLLQIEGAIGVVARNWFTVGAGQAIEEPPPMQEVRRALSSRRETVNALPPEELESLLDQARIAQATTDALETRLELELEIARTGRKAERSACLAEQQLELKRIQQAASAYNERLQRALNQDDPDEIRHLFKMIGLARDEAERQQEAVERCLDKTERNAPVEVRILQYPPQPPLDPARPGAGAAALEIRVPLSPVPERAPRYTLLLPPPDDLWAPPLADVASRTDVTGNAPAPGGPSKDGLNTSFHAGVSLEAVYDSNPLRMTSAQQAGITGGDLEPLVGLLVTPKASLEGRGGFLRARYPVLLGLARERYSDYEVIGLARLLDPRRQTSPDLGLGASWRGDTFAVDALGAGFGEVHRNTGLARLLLASKPGASALEVSASAEGRLEQYRQLSSGARLLRYGGSAGMSAFWRAYPYSVLAADLALGWTERVAADTSVATSSWTAGQGSGWFSRVRVGGEGEVARGVTLEGRIGYQLVRPHSEGDIASLLPQGWVGFARSTLARGPAWCWLELSRELSPVFFADAALFQGIRLGVRTAGRGLLKARLEVKGGGERFFQASATSGAAGIDGWWKWQPYLGGELEASLLLGDSPHPPRLRGQYLTSARWGAAGATQIDGSSMSGATIVHQAFIGTEIGF